MPAVSESEVLLLWRALRQFRSGQDSRLRTARPAPTQQMPALRRLRTLERTGRLSPQPGGKPRTDGATPSAVAVWSAARAAWARHIAYRLALSTTS
jgi:hypothetical protein